MKRTPIVPRGLAILMFVAMLSTVVSCGDSTSPDTGRNGKYTLRTVNGNNLPATIFDDAGVKVEILSSTLTLFTDGTYGRYTAESALRMTTNGAVSTENQSNAGQYLLDVEDATKIAFVSTSDPSSDTQFGTVSGGRISITSGGFAFVYRK
jgi:hypothetical protein